MKKHLFFCVGLGFLIGAGLAQADETPPSSVPFQVGKKHAVLLPVKVGDSIDAQFQLDTGLGFNLISPELAKKLGIESTPNDKVRPVTGGEVSVAKGKLASLTIGNLKADSQDVMIAPPRAFVGNDGETRVDGILSLAFFKEHPFTLDYTNQQVILENSDSLQKRKAAGTKVDCQVSDEIVVASVSLVLQEKAPDPPRPGGIGGFLSGLTGAGGAPEPPKAQVQVATGCESLMLDSKLMFTMNIDATGANITEAETTDQNGVRFRSFASHLGKVELQDRPNLAQGQSPVVFRKLQAQGAQGVLGTNFLRRYPAVTFDLPHNQLIFAVAPAK